MTIPRTPSSSPYYVKRGMMFRFPPMSAMWEHTIPFTSLTQFATTESCYRETMTISRTCTISSCRFRALSRILTVDATMTRRAISNPRASCEPFATSWQQELPFTTDSTSSITGACTAGCGAKRKGEQRQIHEYFRVGVELGRTSTVGRDVYESPTRIRVLMINDELDGGAVVPGFKLPMANLLRRTRAGKGRPRNYQRNLTMETSITN